MSWIMDSNWASFHFVLAALLCCLLRTSNNVILSICSAKTNPIWWQIHMNCYCCLAKAACNTTTVYLKWKSFPYLILNRHRQMETFGRIIRCGMNWEPGGGVWVWHTNKSGKFNMKPRRIVCMRCLRCWIFSLAIWLSYHPSRSIHLDCLFERMTGKKSNKIGHARRVINLQHWNTLLVCWKRCWIVALLSLAFRTLLIFGVFVLVCLCACVFVIGVIHDLSVILPLYIYSCFQHAAAATD